MKALVITRLSGIDALAIQDVPEPTPKPGQSVIRVTAGGLNFADLMTTKGGYPGTPPAPLIAGREFAGVEESTGRRVMGYAQWSAFAEKTVAYSHMLWPTPTDWTDDQAAAFPVNFFTAYLAYWQSGMTQHPSSDSGVPSWSRSSRQGGDLDSKSTPTPRVMIHAVAGGVGTAAVQIGRLLGVE